MQEDRRIDWIDNLRGLAIILVIIGHAHVVYPSWLKVEIYSFHMPLFFFLSGMVFSVSKYNSFLEFLRKKVRTIVVPLIVFSIIAWSINYIYYYIILKNIEVDSFGKYILKLLIESHGDARFRSAFWFLPAIFVSQLALYFIVKYVKEGISIILYIILAVIGSLYIYFGGPSLPWCSDLIFVIVPFMGVGYLLRTNWERISKYVNIYSLVLGIIISVCTVHFNYIIMGKGVDLNSSDIGNPILYFVSAGAGIWILICLFSNQVIKNINMPILKYAGKNSILFYVLSDMTFIIPDILIFNILKINTESFPQGIQFIIMILYVLVTITILWITTRIFAKIFDFILGRGVIKK